MRIEDQYIREAARIIKLYNKLLSELATFEKTLNENKQLLLNLQSEVEALSASTDTDLLKKQKLYDIMLSHDKEIVRMQNIMLPYVSSLEQVKKDSAILYGVLKEKYPGVKEADLQTQIFLQLDEMKKTD